MRGVLHDARGCAAAAAPARAHIQAARAPARSNRNAACAHTVAAWGAQGCSLARWTAAWYKVTGRSDTGLGARASRLQSRRFPRLLIIQAQHCDDEHADRNMCTHVVCLVRGRGRVRVRVRPQHVHARGMPPPTRLLQPESHTVAARVTYGCSPRHLRLQPRATYGCSPAPPTVAAPRHLRLQRAPPTVAARATYGCRCSSRGTRTRTCSCRRTRSSATLLTSWATLTSPPGSLTLTLTLALTAYIMGNTNEPSR
eukprot:scaffold35230_cov34-Phaeocystis_antarctica.AAC.1